MFGRDSGHALCTATSLVALMVTLTTGRGTKLQLAPQDKYAGMRLAAACETALYQQIDCDTTVSELGANQYHRTVGDQATTDSICSNTCSTGLKTLRKLIEETCHRTPELTPGYPAVALLDSIQTGWNETCQKDKETGEYCNAVMDSFADVDEISDMPEDELCSYCFGARLRIMQSSPYSAYDTLFADMLTYVNKKCNIDSPVQVLSNPVNIKYTPAERCGVEMKYIVKDGDTCDSIAESNSVSGATLYYLNPRLANCTAPEAGIELCLPDQCEKTYTVQSKEERCPTVARKHGISQRNIVNWNAGIDSRCSNIWSTNPFWGRVLCLSSPGGDYVPPPILMNTAPGNGNAGGPGGDGLGYLGVVVPPPEGATVAKGTTDHCGEYVQAEDGKGCNTFLSRSAVTMSLFLAINPSLGTVATKCSENLVVGTWYCLHPYSRWATAGDKDEDE